MYFFRVLKPPRVNNTENDKFAQFISKTNRTRLEEIRLYNSVMFNAGLSLTLQKNETAVMQHVQKLDRELDLMMVMEHFHESLVLLKRRACLSLRDIVFLKTNSRRNYNVHKITARDVEELKSWQMADHVAYDHFYAKFWAEVGKEGDGFYREVAHFKEIVMLVSKYCSGTCIQMGSFVVARSEWSEEFSLNASDCRLMKLPERKFQELLVQRAERRRAEAGYRETKKTISSWRPSC